MPTITFAITDEDVDRIAKRVAIKLAETLKEIPNPRAVSPEPKRIDVGLATKIDRKRYLTIQDISEMLKVSQRTVWRMMAGGELPHHRVGRMVRFREDEIEMWLDKQNKKR